MEGGRVIRLLQPNGQYVRVAFERLSRDDQTYVLSTLGELAQK
jgi:hypothetical protein